MSSANTREHSGRIRELDESWKVAAANRDLDGMMANYAEDAEELMPGVPPIRGRDSIRAFYLNVLDQLPRFKHELNMHEIIVADSADLAVAIGTYKFTPDTNRPAEVQTGKLISVWRNRDGDWRLLKNIASSD